MPAPKNFSAPPTNNVTGNTTLTYIADTVKSGNIIFSGNKTLTLVNPGVYVFNSFQWSGNSNKLIFDFNGSTSGIFYIYVKNNADFGKLNSSVANANATSASRIYIEVQGDGTTGTSIPGYSCIIANDHPVVDQNVKALFMQPMEALTVVREQVPAVLPVLFIVQRLYHFKAA